MVSARALEYVSRFADIDAIVEYREQAKQMFHDAKNGNIKFNNYPAQKQYLEDMLERIHALGEARDYLMTKPTKTIKQTKTTKTIKPYAPLTKATAKKALCRTAQSLKAKGYGEHEVKYILRFQEQGVPELAKIAAENYLEDMREQRNEKPAGTPDFFFYDDRVQALKIVVDYFDDINDQIMDLYADDGGAMRREKDWERENNPYYFMEN